MSSHNIGFYEKKTYVVGAHDCNEHPQHSFYEDLTKIIFQLSIRTLSLLQPENQYFHNLPVTPFLHYRLIHTFERFEVVYRTCKLVRTL